MMLKVVSVAVLRWKVREAVLAMVLLMPAMDNKVSGDASLTWMRIAKALVRWPAMGERVALSLFVQLMVGVLSHQVAMWMCRSGASCLRMR